MRGLGEGGVGVRVSVGRGRWSGGSLCEERAAGCEGLWEEEPLV